MILNVTQYFNLNTNISVVVFYHCTGIDRVVGGMGTAKKVLLAKMEDEESEQRVESAEAHCKQQN